MAATEQNPLDTSGIVYGIASRDARLSGYKHWGNLDAFTQGYIEALFASVFDRWHANAGFSDLAPEALAQIVTDCSVINLRTDRYSQNPTAHAGRAFWEDRQAGLWRLDGFSPLTARLADDGRVSLTEQSNG